MQQFLSQKGIKILFLGILKDERNDFVMNEVPQMISTKDLSYISDAVEWNYNAAKKAHYYEMEVIDDDIKNELKKVFKMHKKIAESLLKLLGGKNG